MAKMNDTPGNGNGGGATRHKARRRAAALERDLAHRLSRAEGQMRGLGRMLGGGAYCIDLLQQISAVRRALDRIAQILVRDHLETCVADAIADRGGRAKISELIGALDRFLN